MSPALTKYFTLETIDAALANLRVVDGKSLLVFLVLAANNVRSDVDVNVQTGVGTNKFLDRFCHGSIIGVEPREPGGRCNIRPMFADLSRGKPAEETVNVDYSSLWGSTLSQSGYASMRDGQTLAKTTKSIFRLGPRFAENMRAMISPEFQMESMLVWIFAFTGIPENINSWEDLLKYYEDNYTVAGTPPEYEDVFKLTSGPAAPQWPSAFLPDRPTNEEYRKHLLPARLLSAKISPSELRTFRDELLRVIRQDFLEYTDQEIDRLSTSIVAGLQSCKRLFLLGEPGTGKSELARLIVVAFQSAFGSDRVHSVFSPIADSTTADKLVGFSTLDGSWVNGILTAPETAARGKQLLYDVDVAKNEQINVIILDEANRRDIEELLVKFQPALDSDSNVPEHIAYRIALDNSPEKVISPNTFMIMTGNSPREDSGRIVQSRPFKRRHNLIVVENVFDRVLQKTSTDFSDALTALWEHILLTVNLEDSDKIAFAEELKPETLEPLRQLMLALTGHSIGISYGLMSKLLKTASASYSFSGNIEDALDAAVTEAVFPLLSAEQSIEGRGLRDTIDELPPIVAQSLGRFMALSRKMLQKPDSFGRVRSFL